MGDMRFDYSGIQDTDFADKLKRIFEDDVRMKNIVISEVENNNCFTLGLQDEYIQESLYNKRLLKSILFTQEEGKIIVTPMAMDIIEINK